MRLPSEAQVKAQRLNWYLRVVSGAMGSINHFLYGIKEESVKALAVQAYVALDKLEKEIRRINQNKRLSRDLKKKQKQ